MSSCRDFMVIGIWEVENIEDEGENIRVKVFLRFDIVYFWEIY